MQDSLKNIVLIVDGMSCVNCENKIERALKKFDGVSAVQASFGDGKVSVGYLESKLKVDKLIETIEKLEYKVLNRPQQVKGSFKDSELRKSVTQILGIGVVVFALYFIIKNTVGFNFIPEVDQSMSFGILFVVGLFTSIHCIAMCGGINISQSIKRSVPAENKVSSGVLPSLLYNAGRVVSYTIIGGIIGAIGSVFNFSSATKAVISLLAGLFMVIMGLSMLNIFAFLKRFNVRMPKFFSNLIDNNKSRYGPFIVGLLNGLMPCGPLQSMQLYALGTGSALTGALSMFFFSLGTAPLMFGLGAASSLLSKKFTDVVFRVSAVLVIFLGVIMVNRGLSLGGKPAAVSSQSNYAVAQIVGSEQIVEINLESGAYKPILVQKGLKVKWIIKADNVNLNGCNRTIIVPQYNLQKDLFPGDNIVEFTPDQEGNFGYSCWMGMINSSIKVVTDLKDLGTNGDPQSKTGPDDSSRQNLTGGSCGMAGKNPRFANGQVPTDSIGLPTMKNGVQEVIVTVNDNGYTPALLVLKRGVKAVIKFNTEKLNYCNSKIFFPDFNGGLDFSQGQLETPALPTESDFTFQCWMGMLHGYVKVVDDPKTAKIDEIKYEIAQYRAPVNGGGGGCCAQ